MSSQEPEEAPFRDRGPISDEEAVRLLSTGGIDILGRMPWSSNATFLCDLSEPSDDAGADADGAETEPNEPGEPVLQGIYKPHRGERPLWDFPSGLFEREAAAYELSKALGWDLVPPTVVRDGPVGPGSMQLFIPADFDEHYFTLQDEQRHQLEFQRLTAFDFVANSTDRKSGHCLLGSDGTIWAIDNGLSFHVEFKLRTVLWDFADEPIPQSIIDDLIALAEAGLPDSLQALLNPLEVDATITRARALVNEGRFPTDPSGRRWPWPLV